MFLNQYHIFQKSNLSNLVKDALVQIIPAQKELALLLLFLFTQIGTEIASNSSIVSIFLPISDIIAKQNNILQSYLLIPLTISVSFAYMLPIATPPNALIYATKKLTIKDMVKKFLLINSMYQSKFIIVIIFYLDDIWFGA